ncbi:MAG: hypothetical protein AB1384_12465 [Actinomycetota bacterium]
MGILEDMDNIAQKGEFSLPETPDIGGGILQTISEQLDTIIEKLARIEQAVTTLPEPKVETRTARKPRS